MLGLYPIASRPVGSGPSSGGAPAPDGIAPTFDGALAYVATTTTITVDWSGTTSADNVAVAGREYRIGGSGAYTAATSFEETSSSHAFAGLAVDTEYQIDVRCVDTSGNVSAPLTISATTNAAEEPPAVTDADFIDWLKGDDAIANILMETWALVDGVRTKFCWSTLGYTTEGTDSPTFYEPLISVSIPFEHALSLSGGAVLSAGDIEVANTNGVNQHFASYVWEDDLLLWIGDWRWHRADYRPIFVGWSAGLVRKGSQAFALRQRDMLAGLDYPLSERKFGGTGLNADENIPHTFGECFNPSGAWSDATALERQWHDGPVEGIKAVRANMLPIDDQVIRFDSAGKCVLSAYHESSQITATVQGDKHGGIFRYTIAPLVQRIVTGYGKEEGRYTVANIDTANFSAFDAANPQPVGLHVDKAGINVLVACDTLASSVGAQLVPTLLAKLQLIQIALPAAGPATEIRADHMREGTLSLVDQIDPVAAVKLGYLKSWTVQTGLQSNIPAAHKDLFENEWRTVTVGDRFAGDTAQRNTMLLRRVDATAEAERELALWGQRRGIFEFDGVPEMLLLKLGQRLVVYHELFGMAAGVEAQVLGLTIDWKTRAVKVRFLA